MLMTTIKKVAVLITVFNRRETTLNGLKTLTDAITNLGDGYVFDIFLVDDNSTDGTYEAVKSNYPDVFIYKGSGSLYWNRGMLMAWEKAIEKDTYDYFLWFNDDGELYPDALKTLFLTANSQKEQECVVSGAFCDHGGNCSYVGMDDKENIIYPDGTSKKIVIMFGNLVLIPKAVFNAVGTLNRIYTHGGGDNDYGFRVQKKGYSIYQTPSFVGVVDGHNERPYFEGRSFKQRWNALHSPKYNPYSNFYYLFKYRGKIKAIRYLASRYFYLFFPKLYHK